MKTKFIKKLSFVLVVAMVLSLLVPATGAFAASAKLNSTKKYLHLGREESGENEFNFNVKNKQKGWKYAWESNDEDVVEVNAKNGVVTATGVGKTKVTVLITDEDGEEVDTLSATVTVRDNIETVAVKNPVEKLTVNEEHDYNRSFETESGSTKKTDSITRWEVVPAEGASIDDKGVFVATAAGEYTITARSFQSKARYNAWVDDAEANAGEVLAKAETKVVVAGSMVEAKQVDLDTFTVTFDSAMVKADVEKNLKLSYLAGTTKVNHVIKEVKLDTEGKVATVDVYTQFVKKSTYVVDYLDMEAVQFVSATTNVADVVRAEIVTKTVQIAVPETIEVALYNADGVNIASPAILATDLLNRVVLETSSNATYLDGKVLSMYKVGDTTTIKATYHTYEYDLTTGLEKGVVTAEGLVACVEKKVANTGLLNAYTVVKKETTGPNTGDKKANFGDVKHQIAAGDTNLYLAVELLGKKANGWEDLKTTNVKSDAGFKYTSSNADVLIVGPDASVYPVKEGQASIVVTYNDTVIGAASITVVGSRKVTTVTLDSTNFVLSNDDDVLDYKEVEFEVKDQLGNDFASFNVETKINGNVNDKGLLASSAGDSTIRFEGANVTKGTYTYTVKITDTNTWASTSRFITVNVAEPSDPDIVHHYALEATKSEFDMKINTWDTNPDEDVTLALFGYASNGVRNVRVDLADSSKFKVTIKEPNGGKYGNFEEKDSKGDVVVAKLGASNSNLTLPLVSTGSDDTIITKTVAKKMKTGTYILEAKDASGKAVNATYFTVKDTQAAPTLKINKYYTAETEVVDAINDCFDFNLGGSDLPVEVGAFVIGGNTGKTVFVKTVYVYQSIAGTLIKHEVQVNTVINYAQ